MRFTALFTLLLVLSPRPAGAYSVLTHEAIIDAAWRTEMVPLLTRRFPQATEEDLRNAHAYAYGGAIIQDMGYYPFGSKFFSDLTHYVRSGDFIVALVSESQDLNEYAFALGALAHYASDNNGHPIGVNRAVPLLYPKLKAKYGSVVTYEDDPVAHLKTEFAFDVVEVARGQYAPQSYHDFIGFQVSKPLLERAFQDTYSLELAKVFGDLDLALGTYRYTVSSLMPEMTKTAWAAKKKEIQALSAGMTKKKFVYRLSRSSYRKEWASKYEQPGWGARFLAWLFRLLPKIGPLKAFAFHVPTPDAEKLFLTSFDDTSARYRQILAEAQGPLHLQNENFDIGKPTHRGEYHLTDATYDKLLEKFAGTPDSISPELRDNVLAFYGAADNVASDKAREVLTALRARTAGLR